MTLSFILPMVDFRHKSAMAPVSLIGAKKIGGGGFGWVDDGITATEATALCPLSIEKHAREVESNFLNHVTNPEQASEVRMIVDLQLLEPVFPHFHHGFYQEF